MADITSINGVDIGNVAKIDGIDIGNIAAVNGSGVTPILGLYHTVVIAAGSGTSTMEYRDISTLGNFASFGDYRSGSPYDITARSNGSNQRGIYSGYNSGLPFSDTRIDYITINTPGNSADFGDLNLGVYSGAGFSNNTNERGIHANGTNQSSGSEVNDIQYMTISSLGNASDFGDMINTVSYCAGTDNGTNERGLKFGGTNTSTYYTNVEYITINSTGNGTAFGNLAYSIAEMSSFSNRESDRGISSGGYWLSYRNVIQYWTVSTLSNAYDFGDLITAVSQCAGSSDGISERGMTLSGYTGSAYVVDIQYVTINSTGNASDFGDLATTHGKTGACSNA